MAYNFEPFPVDMIEKQFEAFLYRQGSSLRPAKELNLKLDVKQRYAVEGDKKGETSGVYCVHSDGLPAGYARNFRTDEYCEWRFDLSELRSSASKSNRDLYHQSQTSDFQQYAKQVQKARKLREAADAKQILEDVSKAWTTAPDMHGCLHEYLRAKSVGHYGLKEYKGQIMIPLRDINGRLKSIQYIQPDGTKRFFPESDAGGAFFAIDLQRAESESGTAILLCEGYATGATLYELTNCPVICAMNCHNLVKIAPLIREKFKLNKIVVMCDNDSKTKGNPGLTAAKQAVSQGELDGYLAPEFKNGDKGTDWNDAFNLYTSAPVRRKLLDFIESRYVPEDQRDRFIRVRELMTHGINLDEKIEIPPLEHIAGLFPRGYISLLFAAPGTGKTFFIQKLASDLSKGGPVLGGFAYEDKPRKTLIFVGEARSSMMLRRARLTHWAANPELVRLYDRTAGARDKIVYDLNDKKGLETVRDLIWGEKPEMVIFDSLMSFYTGDEGKSDRLNAMLMDLGLIGEEFNPSVVCTHHTRKVAIKDRGKPLTQDEAIGSTMLARHSACMIAVEPLPGGTNNLIASDENPVLLVKSVKSWDKKIAPFAFQIAGNEDTGLVDMMFDLNPLRSERGNVKGALWDFISQNFKPREWFKSSELKYGGAKERYVRLCLSDFVSENKLMQRGNGRGTEYALKGFYDLSPDDDGIGDD